MSTYESYYNAFVYLGFTNDEAAAEARYRSEHDHNSWAMEERFPESDADEYVGEEY